MSAPQGKVRQYAATFAAHGIRAGDVVLVRMTPSSTARWSVLALRELGAEVTVVDEHLDRTGGRELLATLRPRYRVSFRPPRTARPGAECEVVVRWA